MARIYDLQVCEAELAPSEIELRALREDYPVLSEAELEARKGKYRNWSDDELRAKASSDKLSEMIWTSLIAHAGLSDAVEPSQAEIHEVIKALFTDDAIPKENREAALLASERVANAIVRKWKLNKALYERYGGAVLYPMVNPLEPVEAYRHFLEEHERVGDFEIRDVVLRERFWEYYVSDHSP